MKVKLVFTFDEWSRISHALSEALASMKRSKKHQKEHPKGCEICKRYILIQRKIEKSLRRRKNESD